MTPVAGAFGAMLLLASGGLLVAGGLRARRRQGVERLERALAPTARPRPAPAGSNAAPERPSAAQRAEDVRRALQRLIERAGWTMTPERLVGSLSGAAVGAALVGALMTGGATGALVLAAAAPAGLLAVLAVKGRAMMRRLDQQLPDVLQQLATGMRSGSSLVQAIEAGAEQFTEPIGPQLSRLIAETQVGRPLDEALAAMVERVGSRDLAWSVRAMTIQARTGGRLADLLDVLGEFMRDREEVRREVKALTAEGRISAYVLVALPLVVGGALFAIRPQYVGPLVGDPRGRLMLLIAAVAMVIAVAAMRRIVRVEV